MQDLENTQYFKVEVEPENGVKMILSEVYEALSEKGYDPVSQIVGYIMSGDPTYITRYTHARSTRSDRTGGARRAGRGNAQGVHREESLEALSDQRNNKEKRDASDGA